jgi:hypothetical protein
MVFPAINNALTHLQPVPTRWQSRPLIQFKDFCFGQPELWKLFKHDP